MSTNKERKYFNTPSFMGIFSRSLHRFLYSHNELVEKCNSLCDNTLCKFNEKKKLQVKLYKDKEFTM